MHNTELARPFFENVRVADLEPPTGQDLQAHYFGATPRALARLHLQHCCKHLERHLAAPLRLAQAAKSARWAMEAALAVVTTGSARIGAYDGKPTDNSSHFEASRSDSAAAPYGDRVVTVTMLLNRALSKPLEWCGGKLTVASDELQALEQLTGERHHLEHWRHEYHFVEPGYLALALPVAARLTLELLDVCQDDYLRGERAVVEATVAAISRLCAEFD